MRDGAKVAGRLDRAAVGMSMERGFGAQGGGRGEAGRGHLLCGSELDEAKAQAGQGGHTQRDADTGLNIPQYTAKKHVHDPNIEIPHF